MTAFGSSFSLLYSWMDVLSTVVQEEVMLLPISDRTGTADKEDPSMRLTISPLDLVLTNHRFLHSCVTGDDEKRVFVGGEIPYRSLRLNFVGRGFFSFLPYMTSILHNTPHTPLALPLTHSPHKLKSNYLSFIFLGALLNTMNASRATLLRPKSLPNKGASLTGSSPHKQSKNNFFVGSTTTPTVSSLHNNRSSSSPTSITFTKPSARAIQQILGNIGAPHRASLHTIESCMLSYHRDNEENSKCGAEFTADDVIELMAQIRSI